jgi:hypothetical protein
VFPHVDTVDDTLLDARRDVLLLAGATRRFGGRR